MSLLRSSQMGLFATGVAASVLLIAAPEPPVGTVNGVTAAIRSALPRVTIVANAEAVTAVISSPKIGTSGRNWIFRPDIGLDQL
jgi:hypothetical protein